MFGWIGYKSFWTLDIGDHGTYYMARASRFRIVTSASSRRWPSPFAYLRRRRALKEAAGSPLEWKNSAAEAMRPLPRR